MVLTFLVYSDQELTPRAFEVLKGIKEAAGYGQATFVPVDHGAQVSNNKILVFGSAVPELRGMGNEFIHTYSIAQMMSKANAYTAISTAMHMYADATTPLPETFAYHAVGTLDIEGLVAQGALNWEDPIAIDIETSGNLGKTHTPEDVEVLTVALYQGDDTAWVIVAESQESSKGTTVLGDNRLKMLARDLVKFKRPIYHNGKFDTRVLNRVLGVKLNVWFDTMLAHHVLNHAAGVHGLKPLAKQYFGAEEWERDLSKYTKGGGHYENIPWARLSEYNAIDVYWTHRLFEFLQPQIEMDERNQTAFELEMQAAKMLLDVEATGIPFSHEAATNLGGDKGQEKRKALAALRLLSGSNTFNPNSPKQVKEALAKYDIYMDSTAEAALLDILKSKPSELVTNFIEHLLAYRKATKVIGTYVDGWGKHERAGRVHPTFLVHGTSTGRLSSSAPNAQNMPRDASIRGIVTLTDGNTLG